MHHNKEYQKLQKKPEHVYLGLLYFLFLFLFKGWMILHPLLFFKIKLLDDISSICLDFGHYSGG
jgi:hypothetical protein